MDLIYETISFNFLNDQSFSYIEHNIHFGCCRKRKRKENKSKLKHRKETKKNTSEIKTWFIRNDQSVLSDREWHNYLVQLSSAAHSLVKSGKRQPMKPIDCMCVLCSVHLAIASPTGAIFNDVVYILCSAYSLNVYVELKRIAALSIGRSVGRPIVLTHSLVHKWSDPMCTSHIIPSHNNQLKLGKIWKLFSPLFRPKISTFCENYERMGAHIWKTPDELSLNDSIAPHRMCTHA